MRDIILFTGVISVGKTEAINYFMHYAAKHHFPCEKIPLSDAQCILQAVKEDDDRGGFHHEHSWSKKNGKGHTHIIHRNVVPFLATDTVIPDRMRELFFARIQNYPFTNHYILAEYSGGANSYSFDHRLHKADFSYETTYKRFRKKMLPTTWMKRVKGIVHIKARQATRHVLNALSDVPEESGIMTGKKGWKRMPETFRLFGKDDFISSGFAEACTLHGGKIYTIHNDGTGKYYDSLNRVASLIY